MDGEHKNRKNVPFIVACALLSLSAALCFIDMHYVLDNIHNDAIAFPNVFVGITTFLDAVFLVALVVKGLGLYRGDRPDTSDMVNKCQTLDVMSMFTIVETVFTPLALVTGWYGMNFVNMPELRHPDAYFIVAAILIFFIAVEFSIFKRRRWF